MRSLPFDKLFAMLAAASLSTAELARLAGSRAGSPVFAVSRADISPTTRDGSGCSTHAA